ncbi:unnamed protein product [Fasciola hepatica]|uniref:Membrane-bound transcription factor site-1 protease n=1 Tax=Fasciola hepatica TaxID=6192 RepID=A0ABC9HFA5_FASHE
MIWLPCLLLIFVRIFTHPSSCTSSYSSRFFATTLDDEFIITYQRWYIPEYREKLISSVLRTWYLNHSILYRGYFSRNPSDFDVIKLHNLTLVNTGDFVKRFLERSSTIKHISCQKRLTRTIQAFKSSKSAAVNRNLKVFGKRWRSPTSGTVPLHKSKQPWKLLEAEKIWSMNICGSGVRVGIFDTGLAPTKNHPHFHRARIRERTDWTRSEDRDYLLRANVALGRDENPSNSLPDDDQDEAIDGHGHGTFVAGVIAATSFASRSSVLESLFSGRRGRPIGSNPWNDCPPPGLAPQADLYIFRVFTDTQVSYTSWFLDAFNYAISRGLHVINLSVGGPDFLDQPFVDKVWELSSNGILLVSAIGNDGPLFGTLNNPADQMDVLGVGGVDATGRIARFSSRGMTTWAIPFGYGQVKPDVVTFSTGVISSAIDGKCRTLSGTSVASPVVTGAVALLIDAALQQNAALANTEAGSDHRPVQVPINPASVKQALIAGATRLSQVRVFGTKFPRWPDDEDMDTSSMFEQGAGLVDLVKSLLTMQRMKPQVSLSPSYLDLTECPYMWPYCSQPMYHGMQAIVINVTVLNSMDVVGWIKQPIIYRPFTQRNGHRLRVRFTHSERLWPWVGYLAVHLDVESNADETVPSNRFSGTAEGLITLTVESSDSSTGATLSQNLTLSIRANIVPTPDRSRRILFDQFHSLRYPSGYIPRDDLTRKSEPLDWLGDHMHTNLRDLYTHLRKGNYFVEILTSPYTCFDANQYGALLVIDPEEEFFPKEVEKLVSDVTQKGLSLIVFAEWYNTSLIEALQFYDTNTKRLWIPETGGSNLPALNDLLRPFEIELGDMVYAGQYTVGRRKISYTSGSSFRRFPHQNISHIMGRGYVLRVPLVDLGSQVLARSPKNWDSLEKSGATYKVNNIPHVDQSEGVWRLEATPTDPSPAILGLWTPVTASTQIGRVVVYGDADCLTSTHVTENCFWLLDAALQFTNSRLGHIPSPLAEHVSVPGNELDPLSNRPSRPPGSLLHRISNVLRNDQPHKEFNGVLPREAYREIPNCPTLPSSQIQPMNTTKDFHRSLFQSQPLLLYSDLPRFVQPKPYHFDEGCHAGPLPSYLALPGVRGGQRRRRFLLATDIFHLLRDSLFEPVAALTLCGFQRDLVDNLKPPGDLIAAGSGVGAGYHITKRQLEQFSPTCEPP